MTASFERWELAARLALTDRGVDRWTVDAILDQVRADRDQNGADPWTDMGTPDAFADAVSEVRPTAGRARLDTHGKTPGDYLSGAAFLLAIILVPWTLIAALLHGGPTFPVTMAGIVGTVGFVLSWLVVLGLPGALRAAGRPRAAPLAYLVGTVLIVATGAAFVLLPQHRIGSVAAPVLIVVAVGAATLLTRSWPERGSRPDTDPSGPDVWFRRMRGLLVGRSDVPPRRADELVREARSHLAAVGASPREEFGPAADYAVDIAAAEPRQGPWWRSASADLALRVALVLGVGLLTVQFAIQGQTWTAVVGGLVTLSMAYTVGQIVRRRLRRHAGGRS